jgi:hypothetical protein
MARVNINDLKNTNLTEDDIKHITGGALNAYLTFVGETQSKVTGKTAASHGSVGPVLTIGTDIVGRR